MNEQDNTRITKELALEYYIEQKLAEMQSEKAERLATTIPNWCTKREIFAAFDEDIKSVLNKMFHDKKIKVHKTIHAPIHDYVEYIGEQENE